MTRVDLIYDDTSGVYLDGVWQSIESINVDHNYEERIYTTSSNKPVHVPTLCVTIVHKSPDVWGNPIVTVCYDPIFNTWSTYEHYIRSIMYVIDEVPTLI